MKSFSDLKIVSYVAALVLFILLLALFSVYFGNPAEAEGDSYAAPNNLAVSMQANQTAQAAADDSCRVGVSANGTEHVSWLDNLEAGLYLNFSVGSVAAPNSAEFLPMIHIREKKNGSQYLGTYFVDPPLTENGLGKWIDKNPESLWIVGNEPDRGPDPGCSNCRQDDTHAEVYAKAYHEVYQFIKNRDPSAKVANAGLVGFTPGRQQYLEMVWQSYQNMYRVPMPVDVWTMHLYILSEVDPQGNPNALGSVALGTNPALGKMEAYDPDGGGPLLAKDSCQFDHVYCVAEHDSIKIFEEQVRAMRQWMADHGQREKPLILTEFGILYPRLWDSENQSFYVTDEFGNTFTDQRVKDHLNRTLNFMETAKDSKIGFSLDGNRLIQQWVWFSVNNGDEGLGHTANLVNEALTNLTVVGTEFKKIVGAKPAYVNLVPGHLSFSVGYISPPATTADVELWATVANNGNIPVDTDFKVTFYQDAALTKVIGSATVTDSINGCARQESDPEAVKVVWSGLSPGFHTYWVKVDSGKDIDENQPGGGGEQDNVASGIVVIDPTQVRLPQLYR